MRLIILRHNLIIINLYIPLLFTLLFLKKNIKNSTFNYIFLKLQFSMNLPTVTKSSKRNLHKKLSRYAKKAKLTNLTIEKETAPTLDIGDDKNDKSGKDNLLYEEREEIFYDPNKVS